MPPVPIALQPGVRTQPTPALNATGWSESANIRFFQGLPQKAGGFKLLCQAPANPENIAQGRSTVALRAWAALSGICNLAVAGENRLSVFQADTVSDITPLTIASRVPLSLSTQAGLATVTIFDPLDSPVRGQAIRFRAPVSVGGLVLDGPYLVTAVIDATHYTVTAAVAATATVNGGGVARRFTTTQGQATVAVLLPNHGLFSGQIVRVADPLAVGGLTLEGNYVATVIDPANFTITAGASASSGATAYENGSNAYIAFYNPVSGGTANDLEVEATTLDNWGEFLVAIPQGAPVYIWQPAQGVGAPAAAVATAPLANTTGFVASQQQILVLCGTVNLATGLFDPLLIRWSDVADYTDFAPSTTNQAGSLRLQLGSAIIGALPIAGAALVWTDLAVYGMQYESLPLIWNIQPIGQNCGLIGPRAMGAIGNTAFWMSREQFFVSASGAAPQQIPCAIWDRVFRNLDPAYLRQTTCSTNAYFNEATWYVRQLDGTTTKARLQIDSGNWDYTVLTAGDPGNRSAAIDQNVFGPPIGAAPGGAVYQEETGQDADAQPLSARLLSGIAMIAEGDEFMYFEQIRPDIRFANPPAAGPGTVRMTVYVYRNPQEAPRVKGPYPINARTRSIPCRGRGRGLQFLFESGDLGSAWRIGRVTYVANPDGQGG